MNEGLKREVLHTCVEVVGLLGQVRDLHHLDNFTFAFQR